MSKIGLLFSLNPQKTQKRTSLMGLEMNLPVFGLGMKHKCFWRSIGILEWDFFSFDQGAFGHLCKKPTTCISNLPDMSKLHGCRSGRCERHLAVNLDERLNQTAAWSLWAPGLRAAIKTSLLVLVEWYGFAPPKVVKEFRFGTVETTHQPGSLPV